MNTSLSPDQLLGPLFIAAQQSDLFTDSKTFVDAIPLQDPGKILQAYFQQKDLPHFQIDQFLNSNFQFPNSKRASFETKHSNDIVAHIESLWPKLTQEGSSQNSISSVPLPNPFLVPGGRFQELYYWDTFFALLGLRCGGHWELIKMQVDNFAHLINQFGFVPNANRTYYLARSQPPFFAMMVDLLADHFGDAVYSNYLPQLKAEYQFWMSGKEDLDTKKVTRRVVRIDKDVVLNRFFSPITNPRPESFKEDFHMAKAADLNENVLYQNIRAACESGWDFSSRWLTDPSDLTSLKVLELIPVDLNCLLWKLEMVLAKAYQLEKDFDAANKMQELADSRKAALLQFCWDDSLQFFTDFRWTHHRSFGKCTLAGTLPLFFGLAKTLQAEQIAEKLKLEFLQPGGLMTSLSNSGQQWDAPNGWAPLQWLVIRGLERYGFEDLANISKQNWLAHNEAVFRNTGKMMEKYNVIDLKQPGGGGEYPLQDGFAWTNGVYLDLLKN